jgi:beta-lactamase regulating signal transducer with metallopeptidase domain
MMTSVYRLAQHWLEFFSWMVVQNTLFLLVLFLLLHFLRRAPARLRYVVAFIGLIKLIIPPFIMMPAAVTKAGLALVWQWNVVERPLAAVSLSQDEATLWLFLLWLAVLGAGFAWICWSTLRLYSLLRHGTNYHDPVLATKQPVEIRVSASVLLPWSLRLMRSRIAVPVAWARWPVECRRAVLEHELAHIERRDTWAQMLQMIIQAIYIFHPLVWLLNRRIYAYREMACDDRAIVRSNIQPVQYASYLLDLGEKMAYFSPQLRAATALIWQGKPSLLNRIAYQIREVPMKTLSKKAWILVSAAVITSVIVFSLQADSGAAAVRKTLLWQDEKVQSGSAEQKDSSFDQEPEVLKRINPHYPELARKAGIEGMVFVKMKINKAGRVVSVSCVKSEYNTKPDTTKVQKEQTKPQDPGLIDAALEAAKGWEFRPAEKNGKPVSVEVTMAFNFKLH